MQPLHVAANLSIIAPQIQMQLKECLAWIGSEMGIGQATLLSHVSKSWPYIKLLGSSCFIRLRPPSRAI